MDYSSFGLQDKVAIVTGGSQGIGRAIALGLAQAGAHVVLAKYPDKRQDEVKAVQAEIEALGRKAMVVQTDVAQVDQVRAVMDQTHSTFGRIDILVNNAATNIAQGPCLEMDEGQFDKMVEINLKSTFRLMKLIAPGMCQRGSGSIINIASIAGLRPQYQSLLYSMTKAALIMMTQSYAVELGPQGVRVNAIAPGLIQTALSEYFWKNEALRDKQLGAQPIKHLGQPVEIAEIALTLASDQSSYMTGQTLVVDGGYLLSSM